MDLDGDGQRDTAFAAMQASPNGVPRAGQVYVVWGDGTLSGSLDTAARDPKILVINGAGPFEYAGSELWMDDVTGDGIGDLLIGRQNYTASPGTSGERVAAGALSVLAGGPALAELSERLQPVDLDHPPAGVALLTFVGAEAGGRLGIWMRSGDVTGDGIADIAVGADQESSSAPNAGAVYLLAGGEHLNATRTLDLAAFGTSALSGNIAKLTPPGIPTPQSFHFGATCQIADLDGNGRAEVLIAAALNRAGAVLDAAGGMRAVGTGGPARGVTFIVWDDNFPELPWPAELAFAVDAGTGSRSILRGSAGNVSFGEELLGGLDWDVDGTADLFIGDLAANLAGRPGAGSSHIVYAAQRLRGLDTEVAALGALVPPIRTTTIVGAGVGDISGDTAAHGDFSGDGLADLVVCSPHANPLRRASAGALHVLHGRAGGWPARVDLRSVPAELALDLVAVYGAHGSFGADRGDTLCYSAAAGDLDNDGRADLIANEMVGNGLGPDATNVGNLVLLSGQLLSPGDPGPTVP